MKKAKKTLSIVLAVMMIISTAIITAGAKTHTGTCGEKVTWNYDNSTGTLTISGTGEMNDYNYINRPWEDYFSVIKKVVIEEGVTSIGGFAFYALISLTDVIIPDSVKTIGEYTFLDCLSLISVSIGNGVTLIDSGAFNNCPTLTDVYYSGTKDQWNKIEFDNYNDSLFNATIHFNPIGATVVNCKVGDIIKFGSYPQSQVTDTALLAELSAQSLKWISYSYYSGTGYWRDGNMLPDDYMKYADVAYNGNTYRAVTFSQYRPEFTGQISSADNSQQDDNGYFTNVTYWFIYEPLQWRVLDPDEGFIVCENIIDSQAYNNFVYHNTIDKEYYQNKKHTDYANNYATSSIREWLNDDFYNTAFSDAEKAEISTTTIDNNCNDLNYPQYNSPSTHDKIFLLSYNESLNKNYGFSSGTYSSNTRKAQGTDYAKCQGLWVDPSSSIKSSEYWLRSPFYLSSSACEINSEGKSYNNYNVGDTDEGVRPALKFYSKADEYNIGEETYSFNNFVDEHSTGHCFGMAVTSAGYHLGRLDINDVTDEPIDDAYELSIYNNEVKKMIYHYHDIQGSHSNNAIVAGGSAFKSWLGGFGIGVDTETDWNEVVNYVKTKQHDGKGTLTVGLRASKGGHTVNFLRYEEVEINISGKEQIQERIYIYDNNFATYEIEEGTETQKLPILSDTYLYKGDDGKIYQAPYENLPEGVAATTFGNDPIYSICLMDVAKYFDSAITYDPTHSVYGDADKISVEGASPYLMSCIESNANYTVFEIPADISSVVITPLVDNASFKYMGKEYTFGEVNGNTFGVLDLATSKETADSEVKFTIESYSVGIQSPSRTEIRNKDGIILHANVEGNAPAGSYVRWGSSNGNFDTSADGSNLKIIAKNKGWTTFTAILCDADGNELARDTVDMYSKSGFFDKIGGFFRRLFGLTKIYEN